MSVSNPLQRYKILIADPDMHLAMVLKAMLAQMGFDAVHLAHKPDETNELLIKLRPDILLTDGHISGMGIDLVSRIRRQTARPTLAVMFVSGRAQPADVIAARDVGINEYVKKPFSALSVFSRLARIIDTPRSFVFTSGFIGPDRRSKENQSLVAVNRRREQPKEQAPIANMAIKPNSRGPALLFAPDFSLKQKLGTNATLKQCITHDKLTLAQQSIDSFSHESLKWIRSDLRHLWIYYNGMRAGEYSHFISGEFSRYVLSLRSRSGTFGYNAASEVAELLYGFNRFSLSPADANYQMVIRKHLEILQVIISNHLRGQHTQGSDIILAELKRLGMKFSPSGSFMAQPTFV